MLVNESFSFLTDGFKFFAGEDREKGGGNNAKRCI
jgi:hypothetical protein